ncbi:NAP family protein [Dendryphion nanum]|uniref:NAP family protein n=1 Tax=Dendryphion nanum TaxID=256645 RepID=A0A9P9IX41_9PLEO|nr:NAP family protein [Dendryphion nanum]
MPEQTPEEILARFEQLSVLEAEFEETEAEIIRKSTQLNAPLYTKRAALISKIPHFWALVFEQAPPEVDNFIQPSDSKVFAECLESLDVIRFELDDPQGSPRSFALKFTFSENPYFSDTVLEKKFWFRHSLDGWQGLVSEPVKIHWKKGKDMAEGLTDAAFALHEAKKKLGSFELKKVAQLPEHKALVAQIDESEEVSMSFFAWFGFASSYKWVSAEESVQAAKEEKERVEKIKKGEKIENQHEEENFVDHQASEVFPQGDELATIIADDVFPSAIKYYKHAHEADDEELSDLDMEELDDEGEDEDDDSDVEIDIRKLVGKGKSSGSPPSKKQRKA